MKAIKITAIVLISILTLFLISVLRYGISSGAGRFDASSVKTEKDCSLIQEREFPAEEISSLRILYYDFMDLYFYENDEESVLVREYLNFTPKENQLSVIKADGSTLSVQGKKKQFSLPLSLRPVPWGYTEIYLPSGLYESLQVQTVSGDIRSELSFTLSGRFSAATTSGDIFFPDAEASALSVSSISGDISFSGAKADELSVSTTSGDITLSHAEADELSVSTTSGTISLSHAQGGEISVSSTSGDCRLDSVAGKSFRLSSVSGDIHLKALQGAFDFNTTSGDITVESGTGAGKAHSVSGEIRLLLDQELSGDLTLTSTSGDITLSLPETSSLYLDFQSSSGECNTFFDDSLSFNKKGNHASGQYGGSSENSLKVSTTSGCLRILKTQ